MSDPGQSWGRYPAVAQRLLPLNDRLAALPALEGTALPYGNGRSYGDSCLNPGGTLLLSRALDRFIEFDPATGALTCESGVTLDEILRLALPHGWFLPVTPGTRYATVGGAIANDVHGKNHHRAGTFGHHVDAFELLRSDGTRRELSPNDPSGLFEATVGGLGLTGLITWASLRLRRVEGPRIAAESIRFGSLDEFFAISSESAERFEYTVAWVDCLAKGRALGRGHFVRGNHAPGNGNAHAPAGDSRLGVPFVPPFSLVNGLTLRPFNALYYWRQPVRRRRFVTGYAGFFYPLDGIRDWNRMYGTRGFLQHQCVLPPSTARDAIAELLDAIAGSGRGSFLAVLKEFGDRPPAGLLSFPRSGTTLALDFPHDGDGVFKLLDRLDRIVIAAGGAVYPAKDARMSAECFRRGFPRCAEFARFVDPKFSSGFWRRIME